MDSSEVYDLKPASHLGSGRFQSLAKPRRRKERTNEVGLRWKYKNPGPASEVKPPYARRRDPHGGRDPDFSDPAPVAGSILLEVQILPGTDG